MNADEHRSLGGQFGVQGFPTIKIFGANKKKPEDYNGQRTAQESVLKYLVFYRLSVLSKRLGGLNPA